MNEFEFSRNITIGQYLALDSIIHRMDPRIKLVCFIALVGAITFSNTLTANAILMLASFWLLWMSRIPMRYALSGLKPAIPVVLILAALQITFYTSAFTRGQNCVVFFQWGPVGPNSCGLELAVVSAARFVELLILTSLLTFSTTVAALTLGTERLFAPLQRWFNLPVHELALTMTIALRFVPTFAEELERIAKAQASRGADLGQQGRWRFVRQTRALLPLIIPLFLNALRRADDLVLAMEARCYVGGKGRTQFIQLKTNPGDWIALGFVLSFALLVIVYPFAI
jgi:energy-coupling factor transport system permease protein